MRQRQALRAIPVLAVLGVLAGCSGPASDPGSEPGATELTGGLFCSGAPLGACDASGGEAVGILPDMAAAWSSHLPDSTLTIEGMSWDALMPAAVSGRVDLIIGLGDQESRRGEFTFVDMFTTKYVIITQADNDAAVEGPEDLCGKPAVAATGSGELEELRKLSDEHCADNPMVISEVAEMNTGFLAVQSGQTEFTVTDTLSSLPLIQENPGVYREAFAFDGSAGAAIWGVAIPNDNTELIERVAAAISAARADGSLAAVMESYGADPALILPEDSVNGAPTN